jgi:hypothetical protein
MDSLWPTDGELVTVTLGDAPLGIFEVSDAHSLGPSGCSMDLTMLVADPEGPADGHDTT